MLRSTPPIVSVGANRRPSSNSNVRFGPRLCRSRLAAPTGWLVWPTFFTGRNVGSSSITSERFRTALSSSTSISSVVTGVGVVNPEMRVPETVTSSVTCFVVVLSRA